MARFKASARRIAALNRLERDAIDEARSVLAERKPARRVDLQHGWVSTAPYIAYVPAGRAAVTVLEVFAARITRLERGAA